MTRSKTTTAVKAPVSPPLPDEPLPTSSGTEIEAPVDQPIDSLGDEEADQEEDNEDKEASDDEAGKEGNNDDAASAGSSTASKGKGKATADGADGSSSGQGEAQPWQAVWSAEQNAWYFWNTITSEVTWTNPLDPAASSSTTTAATSSAPTASFQPPLPKELPPPKPEETSRPTYSSIPDIDPDLAYLLPPDQRGGGGARDAGVQVAQFNARSGKFAAADTSRFDALDEFNRQRRFNEHYFDVDAWQKQKDEEHAKRKRDEELGIERDSKITKKDMDRFRKKKAEQRHRKQAWLRD